jgi:TetR/AcrR family transcriptional regulator
MQQKFITKEEFSKRLCELFAQNRISQYPRKRRDRHILLKSIVMTLSNGKDYTEAEINEGIKAWLSGMHDPRGLDHVALRRYLVDEGYLDRSRNGSRYWVIEPGPSPRWFESDVDTVDVFKVVGEAKKSYDKSRRKRGEVRKKILDSATELFAERGFEGASIREIADKAGVTLPNIYYYYKDKQGLYQAALKKSLGDIMETMQAVDDPNLSFRERFLALGRMKMKLIRQNDQTMNLWIKEFIDHGGKGMNGKLDITFKEAFAYMEKMLADAMQKEEIRKMNPKIGVWYLMSLALLYGIPFITKWKKKFEPPTEEEMEEFVDLLMRGFEKK